MEVRPVSIRAIRSSSANGSTSSSEKNSPVSSKSTLSKTTGSVPVSSAMSSEKPPTISIPRNSSSRSDGLASGTSTSSWASPKSASSQVSPSASARGKVATIQLSREVSATSTGTQESGLSSESNAGKFSPSWYMSLIGEGTAALALFCQSDRDLQKYIIEIKSMLENKDEWEMRFTGLGRLQGLVSDLDCHGVSIDSLVSSVRVSLNEPLSSQVSDLRSSVSKEACRTVAILAR